MTTLAYKLKAIAHLMTNEADLAILTEVIHEAITHGFTSNVDNIDDCINDFISTISIQTLDNLLCEQEL